MSTEIGTDSAALTAARRRDPATDAHPASSSPSSSSPSSSSSPASSSASSASSAASASSASSAPSAPATGRADLAGILEGMDKRGAQAASLLGPRPGVGRLPEPKLPARTSGGRGASGASSAQRSEQRDSSSPPSPATGDADLDDKMKARGVPDDQRARVIAHLKTLDGPARERERAVLDQALASKNATRAVATYDSLVKLAKSSPRAGERLTPEVRAALVRGVGDSRSDSDTGQKGVLGQAQAEDAARALVAMPAREYGRVTSALDAAGRGPGADKNAERSLILKAVGARRGEMNDPERAAKAVDDVTRFAGEIRGMDRAQLMKATSAVGLDENGRGAHRQTYADSCGPTAAQTLRAENDPIYAKHLRDDPAAAAREQKDTLERPRFWDKNGNPVNATKAQEDRFKKDGTLPPRATEGWYGVAVDRRGEAQREKLEDTLDGKWARDNLSAAERKALKRSANNERLSPKDQTTADAALAKVRAHDSGSPSDDDLARMRSNYTQHKNGSSTPKMGRGMSFEGAGQDVATPGSEWRREPTNGGHGGANDKDLDAIDKRLQQGKDVPFFVAAPKHPNEEGHFMTMNDVRGAKPNREYMVTDPWTGRSAWVHENEMKKPGWPSKHFPPGVPGWAMMETYGH